MLRKNPEILKRSRLLCEGTRGNGAVLYWMDRDQRVQDNWALLFAQQEAKVKNTHLRIVFCLPKDFNLWQKWHVDFLLGGLAETANQAKSLNLGFDLLEGDPSLILPQLINSVKPYLLVTDFSPLHSKQRLNRKISKKTEVPFYEVDSHNIIPAWLTSPKKEYGAYTIRPKIKSKLPEYLLPIPPVLKQPESPAPLGSFAFLSKIDLNSASEKSPSSFKPGWDAAQLQIKKFIAEKLIHYNENRNDPTLNGQSDLSPYLHFGQISCQALALEVSEIEGKHEAKESFLEELVVRRELADNYCLYEPNYDNISGFPAWAQADIEEHSGDRRDYIYSLTQLENSQTHEQLWNSCQYDLVNNHKLHGYLRMYWAKKILEWTKDPQEAMDFAIYLNDKYSLDGSDPNGYTGIAWSIGGVHDRAWPRRNIFGKIRYMNEKGCRRKFNVDKYISSITN